MDNLAGSLTGSSVLVTEHTAKSRALFRTILGGVCGATVLTAHSPTAAKNVLAVFPAEGSFVVTDLQRCPGGDSGLELLQAHAAED